MRTRRAGADRVRLVVEDSGRGLAPDMCERVFETFYSTEPNGQRFRRGAGDWLPQPRRSGRTGCNPPRPTHVERGCPRDRFGVQPSLGASLPAERTHASRAGSSAREDERANPPGGAPARHPRPAWGRPAHGLVPDRFAGRPSQPWTEERRTPAADAESRHRKLPGARGRDGQPLVVPPPRGEDDPRAPQLHTNPGRAGPAGGRRGGGLRRRAASAGGRGREARSVRTSRPANARPSGPDRVRPSAAGRESASRRRPQSSRRSRRPPGEPREHP